MHRSNGGAFRAPAWSGPVSDDIVPSAASAVERERTAAGAATVQYGGQQSRSAPQRPQQVQSLQKAGPIRLPGSKIQSSNRQHTFYFWRPVLSGLVIVEGSNDTKAVWEAAEVEVRRGP